MRYLERFTHIQQHASGDDHFQNVTYLAYEMKPSNHKNGIKLNK